MARGRPLQVDSTTPDRSLAHRQSAERRTLMGRLVRAREEERRKIAADIHDDSIQAMTVVSMRLQQLRKHMTTSEQKELIARIDEAVVESITRLRELMFDLRPPALDRAGLGAALRELLDRMRAETDIEFTLDDGLSREPSSAVQVELYRIAQEAIANVRKHSKAGLVKVDLQRVQQGYRIRVIDDGVGFDVAIHTEERGHIGLLDMNERAMIAGGWWTIESHVGGGTEVEFWLPDERAGDASAG